MLTWFDSLVLIVVQISNVVLILQTMIAETLHFAFRTPSPKLKFAKFSKRLSDSEESEFDDVEPPNAPKQRRFCRAGHDEPLRRGLLFMEREI